MRNRSVDQLSQIAFLLAALYAIEALNAVTDGWPERFGVIPRTIIGLRGIAFSPLLHGSWSHLIANTAPLAILLGLLALGSRHALWPTTAALWIVTGLIVWLIGRPYSLQIGASGLIYALAAFLVTAAWMSRDLRSGLIALTVIFLYGGIIWGVLPTRPGVSWEGHLSGIFAGFIVARLLSKKTGSARNVL